MTYCTVLRHTKVGDLVGTANPHTADSRSKNPHNRESRVVKLKDFHLGNLTLESRACRGQPRPKSPDATADGARSPWIDRRRKNPFRCDQSHPTKITPTKIR